MSITDPKDSVSTTNGVSEAPETSSPRNEDLERLAAEKAELEDRLLRMRAEFDNFRKRADREKVDILEYAAMDATRALLPVVDDFERALRIEVAPEGDPKLRDYVKGMELIQQRLSDTLAKLGLQPIESLGKPFDPHVHEALQRHETEEAPDGTVLAELQRGYLFKGRLLRPAMVKVAVSPAHNPVDDPKEGDIPND